MKLAPRASYTAVALLGTAIGALGCVHAPSVPPAIRATLVSREILSYQQETVDGVPTLYLAYSTQANLLNDWSTITAEVARIWEPLREETERRQLQAARIAVKSPTDVATFDFRRLGSGAWEKSRHDLEVRVLPGGGVIGLRSIEHLKDSDGPWISIAYVTKLDLAKEKEAVRDEAGKVLSLVVEEAQRSGARKVLVSPSNRIHGGVSVGLLYVRDDATGKWEPRF